MNHGPMREVFQSSIHSLRLQGKSLLHHSHLGRRNSFHHAFSFASMALILTLPAEQVPRSQA